jgi:lysyl-tRNA synthetase class I
VDSWLDKGWIPEKYVFELGSGEKPENPGLIRKFADSLEEGMDEEEIQALAFNIAKEAGVPPRELFTGIYLALIGRPMGPRLGKFVSIAGPARVRELLLDIVQ